MWPLSPAALAILVVFQESPARLAEAHWHIMENESPGTVAFAETQGLDQIHEIKEELTPDRGNYNSPGRESAPTGGELAPTSFCFADSVSRTTSMYAVG